MKKILSLPITIKDFVTGVLKELRLVEFPSKRDTISMSIKVLIVIIISTIILFGLDILFNELRQFIIGIN